MGIEDTLEFADSTPMDGGGVVVATEDKEVGVKEDDESEASEFSI